MKREHGSGACVAFASAAVAGFLSTCNVMHSALLALVKKYENADHVSHQCALIVNAAV
ncbi:hypothetical protein IE4872_PD01381 (plasmid) [Rhizobium gallicum]|uniref:Uncharacterized protein n=1 Tax=Rhizobium gallicum TaxID=56730 RepID=A0A1L5NVI7_9HYPH|nr:hypothetical protein IE4872_PD01381 [Rhizobium gallicum]